MQSLTCCLLLSALGSFPPTSCPWLSPANYIETPEGIENPIVVWVMLFHECYSLLFTRVAVWWKRGLCRVGMWVGDMRQREGWVQRSNEVALDV
jgi:hypothetical protein